GRLREPEALEPGDIIRSTVSGSWTRTNGANASAVTAAFGRNDTDHGSRNAVLVESARHKDFNTVYVRFEALQVETALLQLREPGTGPAADIRDRVYAFTIGGVRDVIDLAGLKGGFGADATFYRTPESLVAAYGDHPVAF